MKGSFFSIFLFAFLICVPRSIEACGPFFHDAYLMEGKEFKILDMPQRRFHEEIMRIAGVDRYPRTVGPVARDWKSTKNGDWKDLVKALEDRGDSDPNKTADRYDSMRQAMVGFYNDKYTDFNADDREERPEFNLGMYEFFLKELPEEFALYARGASVYRAHRYEEAIEIWESLLALPKERRKYRTVWAAFMLGKIYTILDPNKALFYYEETRRLAKEGFADSLQLAEDSLGWQAMAEWKAGMHYKAFRRYIDLYMTEPCGKHGNSLLFICNRIMRMETFDEEMVRDPLCRKVITAWQVAGSCAPHGKKWLDAVQQAGVNLDAHESTQAAWIAYKLRDYDNAKEWLSGVKKKSAEGHWLESKLLLRDGKIDGAMASLKKACMLPSEKGGNEATAQLGVLLLGRDRFVEAMDAFARAGYWADAAYIAEWVLTGDELIAYLNKHKNDVTLNSLSTKTDWYRKSLSILQGLRYLLARKLTRENRWEEARTYYPENIRIHFDRYAELIHNGRDENNPKPERAQSLYDAGKMARWYGLAMMGTETEPDWMMYKGVFDRRSPNEFRIAGRKRASVTEPESLVQALSASDGEKERVRKNAPKPNKRYHYRDSAVSFMWQSAELSPDNDLLTARALVNGGLYAMGMDDVETADRFYKALVKRCPNLPIGKAAAKERWLPRNAEALVGE